MTSPALAPFKARGPHFRVRRYHFTRTSPLHWGCATPDGHGAFLGAGNCRTPAGAFLAVRRARREIPAS